VHEARWFMVAEVDQLIVAPKRLAELVRDLLAHGPPAEPIDAGV
jgi:hypothetical protein